MIVSPRSRYSPIVRHQRWHGARAVPHVKHPEVEQHTRPCSSDSRSGRWVLSQLVLVSCGAGVRQRSEPLGKTGVPRLVTRRTTPASNSPIERFGSETLPRVGRPEASRLEPPGTRMETARYRLRSRPGRQIVVRSPRLPFQCFPKSTTQPALPRGLALNIESRAPRVHADVGDRWRFRRIGVSPQDATAVKEAE